jgi:iron(III) transport system ATP-binding protein
MSQKGALQTGSDELRGGDRRAPGSAVELDALTKRYGDVLALSEVSLTLDPGRFLVLLGPSGSGKSTLIRCLAGIERPSGGTITLAGSPVAFGRKHVPPERRDLAMVFQDFALWPHLTVARNVGFALRRRRTSSAETGRRVSQMLERVGIGHLAARYPHELSGGEQQRVALARALVGQPSLLLFDEPLSSLDANLRERLRIEIGTLVREIGASAVYITHDQGEAFALGDEVGVLEHGALVQHDTPENVYRRPASAFVARFTGLAGELQGRVLTTVGPSKDTSDGRALVETVDDGRPLPAGEEGRKLVRVLLASDGAVRARELLASCIEPLASGQAVQVLVRPAAVTLTTPEDPAGCLHGAVLDSAFRGRGYDHVVRLPDGVVLSEIFDARSHRRGETVGLRIDPDGCLTFSVGKPSPPAEPRNAADAASGTPPPAVVRQAGNTAEQGLPERKPDHDPFHAIT